MERILSWRHTGFNVQGLVRAKTKPEAERVGKYMIWPVLSLERLSFLEQESKVGYRWGRDTANQETMDYLEFMARVTSHIPDKGQVMVRYYGLYANAHIHRSHEADVCGGKASAVPRLRAGRAHGGRGERGLFLIISFSPGTGVYRFLSSAAGFLVPTFSSSADLCGFLWLLTAPLSLRYNSGMVSWEDSVPRAGIQFAWKKQILIFYTIVGGKILFKKSST